MAQNSESANITHTLIRRNMDSILDRVATGEIFFVRLRKGIWYYEERNLKLDASVEKKHVAYLARKL